MTASQRLSLLLSILSSFGFSPALMAAPDESQGASAKPVLLQGGITTRRQNYSPGATSEPNSTMKDDARGNGYQGQVEDAPLRLQRPTVVPLPAAPIGARAVQAPPFALD